MFYCAPPKTIPLWRTHSRVVKQCFDYHMAQWEELVSPKYPSLDIYGLGIGSSLIDVTIKLCVQSIAVRLTFVIFV